MKTHPEMLAEAHRIETLGRDYAAEYRRGVAHDPEAVIAPSVAMIFPESSVLEGAASQRPRRWIAIAMLEGALEYRLLQGDSESQNGAGTFVMGSDSAFDVLSEGYELAERERLAEALAPFADRVEERALEESIEPAVVEEIEAIIGADDLNAAARLHAREQITDFLEGRIEPDEFITSAVERQRYRARQRERLIERHGERLTIGEP